MKSKLLRLWGSPLIAALALAAFFLWCAFLTPLLNALDFVCLFALPLLWVTLMLSIAGQIIRRKYLFAAVTALLFLLIVSNGLRLARWYDNLHLRILAPGMQAAAEQLFESYRDLPSGKAFLVLLPPQQHALSYRGVVQIARNNEQLSVTFRFANERDRRRHYFVYHQTPNPNWRIEQENGRYYITPQLQFAPE